MLAPLLLTASALALVIVAWLFFDGLVASAQHRRAAQNRRLAAQPISLRVVARQEHGDELFSVELEPASRRTRLPAYLPGQALTLVVPAARPLKRRYSLAAWTPRPRVYRLGIRREAGGAASPWLHTHLQIGAVVQALPPVGRFVLDPAHRDIVLVGGGVGITPMAAMADAVAVRPNGRRVWLHYAARRETELIDDARYRTLDAEHGWFHYRPILSRPGEDWADATGRLDAARLMDGPPDPHAAHYYFCAREDMMHTLMDALAGLGVPREQLHWESFGGAQNDDPSSYAVEFGEHAYEFAGQPSLLAAFEDWQLPIDAECRAGECGACRLRLVAGEVADCQASHCELPPGEILACCKVPRSPLKLARAG